jgi:hypothetical protein
MRIGFANGEPAARLAVCENQDSRPGTYRSLRCLVAGGFKLSQTAQEQYS